MTQYKCLRCGGIVEVNDCIKPLVCTYPVNHRTSGICGGGEFVEVNQPQPAEPRLTESRTGSGKGYTEFVKIAEGGLQRDSDKVRKYMMQYIERYPQSAFVYPFTNLLEGKKGPLTLLDGTNIDDAEPRLTAEESYKHNLFCAYLTGQSDVSNRRTGVKGRSFKDWYEENKEFQYQQFAQQEVAFAVAAKEKEMSESFDNGVLGGTTAEKHRWENKIQKRIEELKVIRSNKSSMVEILMLTDSIRELESLLK